MSLDLIPYKAGDRLTISETSQSSGALQYELTPIRPSEGIPAGGAVAGAEINFLFKPSGTRMWDPSNSYVEVRVRTSVGNAGGAAAVKLGAGGASGGSNVAPAPMIASTLFRSAKISCGGTEFETQNDSVAQLSSFLFRTSEWYDQRKNGPKVGWECPNYTATQTAADRRTDLRRSQVRTYQWQPPLGIFQSTKPMPSGQYQLTLGLDPGAFTRAFQSADGAASVLATDKLLLPASDATAVAGAVAAQSCYFEISDIIFYAAYIDYGDLARISGSYAYPLNCVEVKKFTLTSNSDDVTIKVRPTAVRNTVTFQDASASTGSQNRYYTPCLFSPTTTHGNAALGITGTTFPDPTGLNGSNSLFNVNSLQMHFAGHPSTSTNLRLAYNDMEDNMKRAWAYWTDAVGLEHPESYQVYLQRGPLYSFSSCNVKDPQDRSQDLRILVDRDNAAAGSTLLVFTEYESTLIINTVGGEVVDVAMEAR